MNSINFDNVYLLLLMLPLIAVFVVPFALAIRKDNVNGHNIASILLHVVLAVVVAFAAAGTKITRILTETEVYIVADVSYSAQKNLDTIDNYIHDISLPQNSRVGLITFGKDYELKNELTGSSRLSSLTVKGSAVDDSETDIIGALDYASSLFSEKAIKRIVLVTDGKSTDHNASLKQAVDGLQLLGIKVDAIYIDDTIKDTTSEVQISSVDFVDRTFAGSEEVAELHIETTYAQDCLMAIYGADGQRVTADNRAISLSKGQNIVNLDLYTSLGDTSSRTFGYKVKLVDELPTAIEAAANVDYEIRIMTGEDNSKLNNEISFSQRVVGELKILLVTEKFGNVRTFVDRYKEYDMARIDVYEYDNEILYRAKENYINGIKNECGDRINFFTTRNSDNIDLPSTVEKLMPYDEIILADANLTRIPNYITFAASLDTVVSVYGKSLITIGNMSLQNIDVNGDSAMLGLSNMLPVKYTNSDNEPRIYVILVDISKSMLNVGHFVVAREATSRLIDLINVGDKIALVGFADQSYILINDEVLENDEQREEWKEEIYKTDFIQGTLIGSGLSTVTDFYDGDYSAKQIMLISDGLNYSNESENALEVVANIKEDGWVTNVLDVGRLGDEPGSNGTINDKTTDPNNPKLIARQLLVDIAENGGGVYTYSENAEHIDESVFSEIADFVVDMVIERETTVTVNRMYDKVLDGIDSSLIETVGGYINNSLKASANTVLTVNHIMGNTGKTKAKPLYAYWNYGDGKVASLTSSFGEDWLDSWKSDGIDGTFIDNIFLTNVPMTSRSSPILSNSYIDGKTITVEAVLPQNYITAKAEVTYTAPDGEPTKADMTFDRDRFVFTFKAESIGKYNFDIKYTYGNNEYNDSTELNVAYFEEYDEFQTYDDFALTGAIDGVGNVVGDGMEESKLRLENDQSEISKITYDLTLPLLVVAVIIFVIDIVVRKLKWEDIASLFGLGKKEAKKR